MTRYPDDLSPANIEDRIERDRAALARSADVLQARLTPASLAREAADALAPRAASALRRAFAGGADAADGPSVSVGERPAPDAAAAGGPGAYDVVVRDHPVASAIVSAGLAWVLAGRRRDAIRPGETPAEAERRQKTEAGLAFAAGVASALSDDWVRDLDALRDRTARTLRRIDAEARDAAAALRDGVAGGVAGTRDYAAEKAHVMADLAAGLSQGFARGLETLSAEARDQAIAARQRSYDARLRAEAALQRSQEEIAATVAAYPLATGAAALAAGALLGATVGRRG